MAKLADRTATRILGAMLLSGHYQLGRWRIRNHLEIEPTDHFEGILPVPFRVKPEPRRSGSHYRSPRSEPGHLSKVWRIAKFHETK